MPPTISSSSGDGEQMWYRRRYNGTVGPSDSNARWSSYSLHDERFSGVAPSKIDHLKTKPRRGGVLLNDEQRRRRRFILWLSVLLVPLMVLALIRMGLQQRIQSARLLREHSLSPQSPQPSQKREAKANLANARGEITTLTPWVGRAAAVAVTARVEAKGAEENSEGTSNDDAVEVNKRLEVGTKQDKAEALNESFAAARVETAATNGVQKASMGATNRTAISIQQESRVHLLDDTKITPICTKEALYRPRPDDLEVKQYKKVTMAQDIIAYIVAKLHEVDVPVTLMFGTLLHEHRNGTGPCVQTEFHDRDFDMAVFARHFPLVVAMAGDIEKKFGWKPRFIHRKRYFLVFIPNDPDLPRRQPGHQIDVYGFERKNSSSILVPWPGNEIDIATFLPVVRHKMTAYHNQTTAASVGASEEGQPCFHVPYNVPCLLANWYGPDFMTNATKGPHGTYRGPECTPTVLGPSQQHNLQRQLELI